MRKFTRLFFFLACYFVSHLSIGQENLIQSLQEKIATTNPKSEDYYLVKAQLAEANRFVNITEGIRQIEQVINQKSVHISDEKWVEIYGKACVIYISGNLFSKMNYSVDKALEFANKSNTDESFAYAYYYEGIALNILSNEDSITLFFKALNVAEKTKNYLLIGQIYYQIYGYYADKGNFRLENKYAHLCLKAAKLSTDAEMLTKAWQAMGTSLSDAAKNNVAVPKIDSALISFRNGIEIFNRNKDYIVNQSQLGILYLNTAVHFHEFYMPKEIDSIEHYASLALKNGQETNQEDVIANSNGILSQLAYAENDYDKVERLLNISLKNAQSRLNKQPILLSKIYHSLAKLYEKKNDFTKAFFYYELYSENYNLYIEESQLNNNLLIEAKFENEKKIEQIRLLDEKNEASTRQIYLSVGIAVALLISLILLFISYNYKLKYSIEQQKLMEVKTHETSLRAQLKTEEAARLETEQKLILAQKSQLQKELLAESLQVEHKNEVLQNMKDRIASEKLDAKTVQNLNRIFNEEIRIDKDFETVKTNIKEIDPQYIKALQKQSNDKLTQLDLKYCSYIKLNLSTKQMSNLLHVEPSTIRMNKYRLKQKLNLSKETDLGDYLNNL